MSAGTPPVPDPAEDTDVLALVEGSRLTAKQRRFCWLFLHGETAGNAQRSYMEAFGNPNKNTASVGANDLLKDPSVQEYLGALRQQALARVEQKLRPWGDLVEEAQGIVLAIMRGHLRSRIQFDAANAVLDRALGRPPRGLEHELLRDESRVRQALVALDKRRAAGPPAPVRPVLNERPPHADRLESLGRPDLIGGVDPDVEVLSSGPSRALPSPTDSPEVKKEDAVQRTGIKVKYTS